MEIFEKKLTIEYFNPKKSRSARAFAKAIEKHYKKCLRENKNLVFLCIGTDRATGDCLGPLIGQRLMGYSKRFAVYGSLEKPVHAQNLNKTIHEIKENIPNAYIIALDASLGVPEHVGYVTIGKGELYPGTGVNKLLPPVGDAFITGIVNSNRGNSQITLQTTHLYTVISLSDFIAKGILSATC